MDHDPAPIRPKLRPLEVHRVEQDGQRYYLLRDALGLGDGPALIPVALGPLLALCDGVRDVEELAAAFQLRTGVELGRERVAHIIDSLSQGLLLDDERFGAAYGQAVDHFRELPYRPLSHAGAVYPADPAELEQTFTKYLDDAGARPGGTGFQDRRGFGVVSPHIDYHRGWRTYAEVWSEAAAAVAEAEVAVIFGTDHAGGPGRLTLTRQSYATPFGTLPTAQDVVDALAAEIGEEDAFAEEYHHRREHSIELALVWLHYFLRPREIPVVPILCGSFYPFVLGEASLEDHDVFQRALDALRRACEGRKTLYVAAGDLAHVGPAFGDALPWSPLERATLRQADEALIGAMTSGDSAGFFDRIRSVGDRNRICGGPPIYLTLRMLEGAAGAPAGYEQCSADPQDASFVSIAGAVLGVGQS